jgi:dTDP-N-acetylfucosamine:lipid II N-acetylfucosaminyltransferase
MTHCKAQLLCWNYTAGFSLENMKDWRITGSNWLIGNAARYALNHIEIMKILRKIKGHPGNIISPLSYGDSELYQKEVLQIGQRWFGERFCPMLEFAPIEQYFSILKTCSAAFFNTPRQHAMGSILVSLYLGARVFYVAKIQSITF